GPKKFAATFYLSKSKSPNSDGLGIRHRICETEYLVRDLVKLLLLCPQVDPKPIAPAVELAAADSGEPAQGVSVSSQAPEMIHEVVALELLLEGRESFLCQQVSWKDGRGPWIGASSLNGIAADGPGTLDSRPRDDVSELSHIAWPG